MPHKNKKHFSGSVDFHYFKHHLKFVFAKEPLFNQMRLIITPNWTSKREDYLEFSSDGDALRDLFNKLCTENKGIRYEYLEVLPINIPRRCFFDLDVKNREDDPLDTILRAIIEVLTEKYNPDPSFLEFQICCSSFGSNGKFCGKWSYHITLPFILSPDMNQYLADLLNKYLNVTWFDLNVYHTTQFIRLAGCVKPLKGVRNIDVDQRVKRLSCSTYDDFLNSLVSNTDGLSALTASVVKNNILVWFEKVLNEDHFRLIWKKKADNYPDMLKVGFTLAKESKECNDEETGLRLYLAFAKFSAGYDQEKCINKFKKELIKAKTCSWGTIRKWLSGKDEDRVILKRYESYLGDEVHKMAAASVEFTVLPEAELEDLIIPSHTILPYYSNEYRFLSHFRHNEIFRLWRTQIKSQYDSNKIISILKYRDTEENDFWEIYKAKKEHAKEYGDIELPYDEIEEGNSHQMEEIVIYCLEALQIPYDPQVIRGLVIQEYEEKSLQSAFNNYIKQVSELLPVFYQDLENEIAHKRVFPVRKRETVDPWERILFWIETVEKGSVSWKTQIPYRHIINDINNFYHADNMMDNYSRKVLFTAFVGRFKADQIFHYICSAHCDTEAASIIYSMYPYWCFNEMSRFYVYDEYKGLWSTEHETMNRIITIFAPLLQSTLHDSNYGNDKKGKEVVLKELQCFKLVQRNTKNFTVLQETSFRKVLFPNGYYDGDKDLFIPRIKIAIGIQNECHFIFAAPEILFLSQITDNFLYLSQADASVISEMRDILFLKQHGEEVGRYHIEQLAGALFGEKWKEFYVHIGDPNSGKSTEISLTKAAFGTYFGEFNIDEFKFIKGDKRESALENNIAYENWYKRLLVNSESTLNEISNEKFKLHTSGKKDGVRTRIQYKTPITVTPQYLIFCYVNEMWKWTNPKDPAIAERANFVEWNKTFVDEVTDPSCQLKRLNVDIWSSDEYRRQLYIHIMLSAFREYRNRKFTRLEKPLLVRQAKEDKLEALETASQVFEKLMWYLEFHGDSSKYITTLELKSICESNKWSFESTTRKITDIINHLKVGVDKTIRREKKKIQGSTQNVLYGVSLRASFVDPVESNYLTDFQQWKGLMEKYDMKIPSWVLDDLRSLARIMTYNRPLTPTEMEIIGEYATEDQKQAICERNRNVRFEDENPNKKQKA